MPKYNPITDIWVSQATDRIRRAVDNAILDDLTKMDKPRKLINWDRPLRRRSDKEPVRFIRKAEGKGIMYPYLIRAYTRKWSESLMRHICESSIIGLDEYGYAHHKAIEPYVEEAPIPFPEHDEGVYF